VKLIQSLRRLYSHTAHAHTLHMHTLHIHTLHMHTQYICTQHSHTKHRCFSVLLVAFLVGWYVKRKMEIRALIRVRKPNLVRGSV